MDTQGYTKIAAFMAEHPEDVMVRRFANLNLQNILYLQAEIVGLEKDLRALEAKNNSSEDRDRRTFALDWYTLAHMHNAPDSGQQWEKWQQLRKVLKEYNDAVFQYCQISKFPGPEPHELHKFQSWLREPRLGGVYLVGRDHDTWAQGADLMSLSSPLHPNRISRFITNKVLPVYHHFVNSAMMDRVRQSLSRSNRPTRPSHADADIVTYEDSRLIAVSNFICTVIASLLPILAIIVLYFVENMGSRLGLVGVFSVVFSSALWFMNDGELVEVFGATSAFAAVQVVFIGTSST
ncbi:hypothetical protein PFICI_10842 [Pestalotiopsis fici W106-1]|uniref:DUF6594 domain-containing protein n=1 Tax=Pestalotiopsis fici (strain W106-1 / CGMCC3.15140) TaxID=1229662 RepID=W3WSW7_PESFW|nr:uncharacterized protein PFICI_10842 [Pestalotiopsis fici W106-1]ETS76968.1 hypothetical protein PFICI_10842 [Pestalotiopsis fici W106-1]